MGMNMVTNRFVFRTVELPKMPTPDAYLKVAPYLIEKAWSAAKSDLSGLSSLTGLKLGGIEADSMAIRGRLRNAGGEGPGRLEFDVALFNFSLEVWVYYPGGAPGAESLAKVAVTKDVEAYREFLTRLNGWSLSGKKLVTDADLKAFSKEFPPKLPKPTVYKNYAELAKKSKEDLAAFRAWSKKHWKAAKAFDDLDKSAKLKADDPARGTALKAIDAALKDYYASL
ncbi:MAG: hypothetical protein K8R60_09395 [Burkholderiales bacterium]|nr:hypothetical protein [Burkholderiales bacterium]